MRTIALATVVLLLAGCSSGPADSPATPAPPGPSATVSATATSPVTTSALTVPELPGEIARSVFGADRRDIVSGDAVEGATLEVRAACTDPGGGTALFEVLDARVDPSDAPGSLGSVLSGELPCNGTEVFVSTIATFSGPLQITFRQVPESAVAGYAILSSG